MKGSKINLEEIFFNAIKAVEPYDAVKNYCEKIKYIFNEGDFENLIVIGFGKAVNRMSKAMEDNIGALITRGIIITKYGHSAGYEPGPGSCESKITLYEAGHPLPDENGLKATKKIIELVKRADKNTLVVCLISGGGSSLFVAPYKGISLTEKQMITDTLLKAGADIGELNTVRKHISKVKGGRLAEIAYPTKIVSLIFSDVIGDRIDVIASGPTSPDETTYNDALKILEKYDLADKTPKTVLEILRSGLNGLIPETPKGENRIFEHVENIIIGSNKIALYAAKEKACALGLTAEVISAELTGQARDVGEWLAKKAVEARNASKAMDDRKICLISGGETTVTVRGNGLGGRNMELALSFAMEIEGVNGITLLSAGTDGTDGPTDAAGAIVDGQTIAKAKSISIDPRTYLANNDSYHFFDKIDGLFITGPTGTNVMDIQIIIIE